MKPVPQATSSVRFGGSAATALELGALLVPAGTVLGGVEAAPEPPVVVLARPRVVVGLHRVLEYGRAAARVGAELLRGARPRDDRRDRRGAVGAGAAARRPRGRRPQPLGVHAVGEEAELVEALVAGVECARERIDLRRHEGAHPRIGAADVVPLVPIAPGGHGARAGRGAARWPGGSASSDCRCSSTAAPGRGPAFFRRGGPEELQRRIDAGELAPDFGPAQARPRRRRRARRRAPAADRVQRQPAERRRRGRTGDRGGRPRDAAAASPACARSASTCRAPASSR